MTQRTIMAMLYPLLAVLLIATYGGGLGVIFMVLYSTGLGEWGPVILGVALVIGVPIVAYLLQQRLERE